MKTDSFFRKILSQKYLFFFGMILISSLIVPKKVQSQTSCVISNPQSGNLVLKDGYVLYSEKAGSFLITCERSIDIRIDNINDFSQNSLDQASIVIFDNSTDIVRADNVKLTPPLTTIGVQSSTQIGPISSKTYSIDLTLANTSTLIPAGDYRYQIGITLVPH